MRRQTIDSRLAEGQVTNDIEHAAVVPGDKIEWRSAIVPLFLQSPDEEVDVACDYGLLLTEPALTESMSQCPSQAPVLLPTGVDDVRGSALYWTVVVVVLLHLGCFTTVMSHDVFPCLGVCECELVWSDANDIAVLFVERKYLEGDHAGA